MEMQKCNIIKDLLPLYVEELVSEDTKAFVEEHLAGCAECRAEQERIVQSEKEVQGAERLAAKAGTGGFFAKSIPAGTAADAAVAMETDAAPLRKLKKMLFRKKLGIVLFTAALTAAVVMAMVHILTEKWYLPYSENIVQITEGENGYLILTFADDVTNYNLYGETDPDSGEVVYFVSAWNTLWRDRTAKKNIGHPLEEVIALPKNGASVAVYYETFDGTENVFLYGEQPSAGVLTLPTNALAFYLFLAIAAALVLGVLLFILRKKKSAANWLWYLFFVPISYVVGHLLIKGIMLKTYYPQNEFIEIVIGAVFIYCAILLGIGRYRVWKEMRGGRKFRN